MQGKVERLTIAVTNAATRQPLEQFVLDFGWIADVNPAEYVREAERKRRCVENSAAHLSS